MNKLCIVLIAERDYDFFSKVALALRTLGNDVTLLSFHTPQKRRNHADDLKIIFFQDLLKEYSSTINISQDFDYMWTLHESVTFELNRENLSTKFQRYEKIAKKFLAEHRFDFVIQELGGFVAPLSVYKACLSTETNHLFIEPTFLKGHLGFIKDDLKYKISPAPSKNTDFNAKAFIDKVLLEKMSVIPKKDEHHFMEANLKKFLNVRNISNIYLKLYYKYVLRLEFEYKFVGIFIRRAISALLNKKYLSRRYRGLSFLVEQSKTRECFFFPFHVKLDFSLTVRSPENLNQLSVVNRVCELIGQNSLLFVKEHPASSGAYGAADLKSLKYPEKVIWLRPNEKTFDIIKLCKSVFTINSKAGVEAMIMDVPVFCVGDSYYLGKGLAVGIDEYCQNSVEGLKADNQCLLNFIANLAFRSFPCELYQNDADNISKFCDAVLTAINEERYLNV